MKKLQDKTREAALQLNDYLLHEELIKEYQRYEALLQAHPELQTLEEEIKALQKDLIDAKAHDRDMEDLTAQYQEKLTVFNTHPLVVNYRNLKEDVNAHILEIESLINHQLEKTVD